MSSSQFILTIYSSRHVVIESFHQSQNYANRNSSLVATSLVLTSRSRRQGVIGSSHEPESNANMNSSHQDVIVISDDSENDESPRTSQMTKKKSKSSKTNNIIKKTKSKGQGNIKKTEKSHKVWYCPICYYELGHNPTAVTLCGHVFCVRCLQKSLIYNGRCPTCMWTIKKETDYHPLYLP